MRLILVTWSLALCRVVFALSRHTARTQAVWLILQTTHTFVEYIRANLKLYTEGMTSQFYFFGIKDEDACEGS